LASGVTLTVVTFTSPVRYRCAACGNVTRFDVTVTRRTRAFHHFTVGGDLTVEDEQVLSEQIELVSCRWCGSGAAVTAESTAESIPQQNGD
jgi:hypothetical protein